MRLKGKRIVVTGGAGGLGSAISRGLIEEGASIGILDAPSARTDEVASSLGAQATALGADVRDEVAVAEQLAGFCSDGEALDALVVTAGVQLHGEDGPAAAVSLENWQRTIDVNLTGAFLCVKHGLPALVRAETSSLILVGSPTGLTMSGAGYTAYSASKAGMMALGRTVAADYADQGLRANVVVPGTMQTPLISSLIDDDATRGDLLAGTPLGRLGTPADLVGISVWLASDESTFATGGFFVVDGGLTAR